MTDVDQLSDDELAELAWQWRARALHGDASANGRAHELERELRRRLAATSTRASLEPAAVSRTSWWRFWR